MIRHAIFLIALLAGLSGCGAMAGEQDPAAIVRDTWKHYRATHLRAGRVLRPENGNDTVSEGQAYMMLRAVLLNDRRTFDECLAWTESNLSRHSAYGDRLLMWHYTEDGKTDPTPASDADVDYAASLVLAWKQWGDPKYLELSREVMDDILELETVVVDGRRLLAPWPLGSIDSREPVPQNPSYYAPAEFRMFHEISGDARWLELVDTTYWLLDKTQGSFNGCTGKGLVPDWCRVTPDGDIVAMPDKGAIYGWDAVRVPLRIGMDWSFYHDKRALKVLKRFAAVFGREMVATGRLCSTYCYPCHPVDTRENPVFYAAAYIASIVATPELSPTYLNRLRSYLKRDDNGLYYLAPTDYYPNSLCWLPEYHLAKSLQTGPKQHD